MAGESSCHFPLSQRVAGRGELEPSASYSPGGVSVGCWSSPWCPSAGPSPAGCPGEPPHGSRSPSSCSCGCRGPASPHPCSETRVRARLSPHQPLLQSRSAERGCHWGRGQSWHDAPSQQVTGLSGDPGPASSAGERCCPSPESSSGQPSQGRRGTQAAPVLSLQRGWICPCQPS